MIPAYYDAKGALVSLGTGAGVAGGPGGPVRLLASPAPPLPHQVLIGLSVPSHSSPVTRVNLWLEAISIMCTFTIYIHFQQTNFPSLDPQSHPYLPQLHFLAGGETPWTETQTLRSLPPWATTTSRSRVNKELVDGEDSPATELWARLRAWSDWPAPQDPLLLHP